MVERKTLGVDDRQKGISSSVIGSIGGSSAATRWVSAAAIHPATTTTTCAASAAEQRHAVGLDLSRVALVAVLVVPLPRLQTAFYVDLFSLCQVFLQAFRGLSPEHDAVPLGLLLPLVVAVVPDLRGGQVERGHCRASWCVAQLGVATQVADEDHLVHTSHVVSFRAADPPLRLQ